MKINEDFLHKITQNIEELKTAPLFGSSSSFDFEEFSEALGKNLQIEDLSLRMKSQEMQERPSVDSTMYSILLSPIDKPIYWAMSKSDKDLLTAKILLEKPKKKAFNSPILQEGFYQYLLLETLHVLSNMDPLKQMTLQLQEEKTKIQESSTCIDIEISFDQTTCWGKLYIPEDFRKKWVQHFAAFPPQYIPSKLSKRLPIILSACIGSISLKMDQLKKIKKGDFLIPDHLYHESHVVLTLNHTSLFTAKKEHQHLKIEKYAFTSEEPMEPKKNLSEAIEMKEKESSSIHSLPINVHIEIARLNISLDELMHLSPGNVLDLPEDAENKVLLSVNGGKIGVAELIHIGNTLGLKILEI